MKTRIQLRNIITGIAIAALLCQWQHALTYSYGPPGGYTNAPNESNCTDCHSSYSLNTSSSVISLTINGTAAASFKYKRDSTYTVKLTVASSGISTWGFEATTLKDSNNTFVGTLKSTSSDVQTTTATISGGGRVYVEHTSNGNSGSGGRSWSFSWKAPHTNVGSITFYTITNAANGDGTDGGDKIYANTFTINPSPVNSPVPGFTFSPTKPCEGDTVYFKDTSTLKPTSWEWDFSGGNPSVSYAQNPKVVFASGTRKITLTATNSEGSSDPYSKNISVTAKPLDTLYRSGPVQMCIGDSITLTASLIGDTYKWSSGSNNQAITVNKSGSFYCTVSNSGCTTVSQTANVEVFPKPTISLTRYSAEDSICSGDTVVFMLATNGTTYAFYNNGTLIQKSPGLTLSLPKLTGSLNRIYAIAYDSIGCPSDTSTIYPEIVRTRLNAPVLAAGKSTTQSVIVTWTPVAGAIAYEASADSGKTWKASSGKFSDTESNIASNTYIAILIRAKDNSVCGHGTASSILVSTLPCSQTTYNLHVDSQICARSPAMVIFSKISAPHYGIILDNKVTKDTSFTFYPKQDTTIHFAMLDSLKSTCGSFAIDIPIKLTTPPGLSIFANKPSYCGDEPAVITGGGNFDRYDVYQNGLLVHSDNLGMYYDSLFNNGDKVTMIGTVNGCPSDTSNSVVLTKYPNPEAGFSYQIAGNREILFTDTSKLESARTWYFGDGATDTSLKPEHTYSANNTYNVSLVANGTGGCHDSVSEPVGVTGIEEAMIPESFTVSPNPFNNFITISFFVKKSLYLHLYMVSILGNNVVELGDIHTVKGNNEIRIPVGSLKPGTFILKIDDGVQILSRRLIKI